jgi:CHAD domain-containing protein
MNRDELMRTTHRHITRLRLLLKKVAAGFSVDDIHELRVEAKKLRALLRLAGPDDRRFPKAFRHIYKTAGEMRNLQLLRRRLESFRGDDQGPLSGDFFVHLDQRLLLAKQETRRRVEAAGRLKKLSRRSISGLPLRLSASRQAHFVDTHIRLSHPGAGDIVTQLHALRKSLKDLLYVWPYLDNPARRRAARHFGRYPLMKENARLLGDFLDVAFQLRQLDDRGLFPGDLDLEMLHELRDYWAARQDRLLRHLDKVLHVRFEPTVHAPLLPEKAKLNPLAAGNPSMESVDLHLD